MEPLLPYSISQLSSIAKSPGAYLAGPKDVTINLESVSRSWHQLKKTVHSPSVIDKHITSACNAMCAVIRYVAQDESEEVRSFAYSVRTFEDLFNASLKAFDSGKNKPGLQVLETQVHLALDNPCKSDATIAVDSVVKKMVMVLMERGSPSRLKESCIVLYYLLRKASNIVSYPAVITSAVIETSVHRNELHDLNLFEFFLAIVFAVSVTEARTAATKLFSHLCSSASGDHASRNLLLATRAIETCVNANDKALDDLAKNLFPALSSDTHQFKVLLAQYRHVQHNSVSTLLIVMSLLEIGRGHGFVSEVELPVMLTDLFVSQPDAVDVEIEDYQTFQHLLSSRWPQVRLRALNLLLMSPSTNTLMPIGVLQCLLNNKAQIHDETDSYMRGELLSIFKRLMIRLQRSWQSPKILVVANNSDLIERTHAQYTIFICQFFEFLRSELSIHVSYTRRVLSLLLMEVILNYRYDYPTLFRTAVLVDTDLLTILLPLLIDAYEDVREVTTRLLLQIARHDFSLLRCHLQDFDLVQRASIFSATTNRNDHADGFGRMLMLNAFTHSSKQINSEITPAKDPALLLIIESLQSFTASLHTFSVSSGFPLHGKILGLKHIFDNTAGCKSLLSEEDFMSLMKICQSIWNLAQPYLCVDSPETEAEDLDVGDSAGPKDLLSYSWRALRDSSLLIQGILKISSPSKTIFSLAGDISFDQLARLRHRGAFSTVAQTFALCCHLVRQSDDPQIQILNDLWYQKSFAEIEIQSTQLTRRSAGLPAMLVGVLDAKLTAVFRRGIDDLWTIAMRASKIQPTTSMSQPGLPQVHALNCLKDIMTNSRFRTITETLVIPMLNLAASCFTSSSWAIRNCGLMLFRACITRLDSDAEVIQSESEESFLQQSDSLSAFDLAVALLSESSNLADFNHAADTESLTNGTPTTDKNEAVFAALDLLSRIYIKNSQRPLAKGLIKRQLGSQLWHVRELAARLFAALIPDGNDVDAVNSLLSLEDVRWTSNELHGRFVACREIIRDCIANLGSESFISLRNLINTVCTCVSRLISVHRSTGMSPALDMMNEILATVIDHPAHLTCVCESFSSIVKPVIRSEKDQSYLIQRAFTLFEVYNLMANNTSQIKLTVEHLLRDGDIALYVMHKLEPLGTRIQSRSFMFLCVEIILNASDEDVRCAAMQSLCGYLKRDDHLLPEEILPSVIQKLNINDHSSRHSLTVRLKFSATIIRDVWKATEFTPSVIECLTQSLLRDLKTAVSDTIDTATRLAAIEAIEVLAPALLLQENLWQRLNKDCCLDLFILLYNLSNDDDQDIRWQASGIVDMLTKSSEPPIFAGIGTCSISTRENLLSFLVRHSASENTLHEYALRKLFGLASAHTNLEKSSLLEQILLLPPIKKQIETIVSSTGDLFAEEKQNLYIDEIADSLNWARLLSMTRCDFFDDETIGATTKWAVEGLKSLLALFKTEVQEITQRSCGSIEDPALKGHGQERSIFSFTFNADVMIIIVRLLALASVLRTSTKGCSNSSLNELESLLLQFREVCQAPNINPWIVKAIAGQLSEL